MLELKDVHVTFGKGTQLSNHVLKGINLKVNDGEFVTIIGGNGAGKSTLMNIVAGDVLPDTGQILIDGKDVTKLSTDKRAKLVARVFQDPMIGSCAALTIEENLSLAYRRGQCRGLSLSLNKELRKKFKESLADLGIGLENRLKDKVASLSGGQRQAVSLVMATLQPSKILLLDEHTAALDPKMAKTILELTQKLITKHKLTALMITHSMSQALEYGSRTIMMYHGEITKDMDSSERTQMNPADLLAFFDL
jgi:putative ABC transport system ATP-binding protein